MSCTSETVIEGQVHQAQQACGMLFWTNDRPEVGKGACRKGRAHHRHKISVEQPYSSLLAGKCQMFSLPWEAMHIFWRWANHKTPVLAPSTAQPAGLLLPAWACTEPPTCLCRCIRSIWTALRSGDGLRVHASSYRRFDPAEWTVQISKFTATLELRIEALCQAQHLSPD